MENLQVAVGTAACDMFCNAIESARSSVDAEFYTLTNPKVIESLNDAARRNLHVEVHLEAHPQRYEHRSANSTNSRNRAGSALLRTLRREFDSRVSIVLEDDPKTLMHGKALVVDDAAAYVATANPTWKGFVDRGDIVVKDTLPCDIQAVKANIEHVASDCSAYAVGGTAAGMREPISKMLAADHDVSIASEDLSDREVVAKLIERHDAGYHDRVLIGDRRSAAEAGELAWLRQHHVAVHMLDPAYGYMHAKYLDAGDTLYVGSANLTRNGLEEAHEVGIILPAAVESSAAATLRASFEANWAHSIPA